MAYLSPQCHFAFGSAHIFDSDGCFNGCQSISETLERLQHIRTNIATLIRTDFSIGNFHRFLSVQCVLYTCSCHASHLLSAFCLCFAGSLFSQQVIDRLSSSASTVSSIDNSSEHNAWNPLLDLVFLKHVSGIVDSYLGDFDLAKIAFSCHFAIDLLCDKEEVLVSAR